MSWGWVSHPADSLGRTSVMETRGAQVEGFSPFRTTGYSGQVSCKGTKLMIYPLSPKALKELFNVKRAAVSSHSAQPRLAPTPRALGQGRFWGKESSIPGNPIAARTHSSHWHLFCLQPEFFAGGEGCFVEFHQVGLCRWSIICSLRQQRMGAACRAHAQDWGSVHQRFFRPLLPS